MTLTFGSSRNMAGLEWDAREVDTDRPANDDNPA